MENTRKSPCGRTSPGRSARTKGATSTESSKNSVKSATPTLMFLDRRTVDGARLDSTWEIITPSLGDSSTPNIGESPKDASVSSLSSILEDNVPEKYFLSVKACEGILRRSDERGKPLAELLVIALKNTIAVMRWKATRKTSEFPYQEITLFKPSQGVWEQGGGNVPLIICRATAQGHAESCEDLAPTVTAAAGMSGNNQPIVTVPVSAAFMRNPSGDAGGIGYEEEVSPTLLADRPPGAVCPVGFSQKSYDEYENDGVAPTLKAKGGSYGGGRNCLSCNRCRSLQRRNYRKEDNDIDGSKE